MQTVSSEGTNGFGNKPSTAVFGIPGGASSSSSGGAAFGGMVEFGCQPMFRGTFAAKVLKPATDCSDLAWL